MSRPRSAESKANLLKQVLKDPELRELLQEIFKQDYSKPLPPVFKDESQAIASLDAQIVEQERTAREQQMSELVDICVPFDYKASINGVDWVVHANVPTKVPSGIKANLERILNVDKENNDFLRSQGVRRE